MLKIPCYLLHKKVYICSKSIIFSFNEFAIKFPEQEPVKSWYLQMPMITSVDVMFRKKQIVFQRSLSMQPVETVLMLLHWWHHPEEWFPIEVLLEVEKVMISIEGIFLQWPLLWFWCLMDSITLSIICI